MLGQIRHILSDKQRLVKRTQLKRLVYKVLGKCEEEKEEEKKHVEGSGHRNAHLKEYSDEIFDDDDFYHQVGWLAEQYQKPFSHQGQQHRLFSPSHKVTGLLLGG